MCKLFVDNSSARKYTDAFYDYLIDLGYINEDNPLLNLLYWLSDDDVCEYARVNFDIEFVDDEDEIDEEDDFIC